MIVKIFCFFRTYWFSYILYLTAIGLSHFSQIFYSSTEFKEGLKEFSPKLFLLMSDHPLGIAITTIFFLSLIPLLSIPTLKKIIQASNPIDIDRLLIFNRVLEIPVSKKLNRFGCEAKRIKKEQTKQLSDSVVQQLFFKLARPKKQMRAILESIYLFLKDIDERNADFKIVLFFFENENLLEEPLLWYPDHCSPGTPIELLKEKSSAVMTAHRKKRPVIIKDTTKPPRGIRFCTTDNEPREGSLLCYPIIINNLAEARMVISIFTRTPKYFDIKNKTIYNFILEKFEKRLVIEHCLDILKTKAKAGGTPHG